jgi:hypothetical protein
MERNFTNSIARQHRSQAYIVVPASLRTLHVYGVVQDGASVRVEVIQFGLPIFAGFYAVWIAASVWYFRRVGRP